MKNKQIHNSLIYTLKNLLPDLLISIEYNQYYIILTILPKNLLFILRFLRDYHEIRCKQLIDIFAVDYPERIKRFELNYYLISLEYNLRILIKTQLNENEPVNSCINLYNSAGWLEREVWDLFGIFFSSHTDLRRILTDYGFEGHPLRKDFPVTGYIEIKYDDETKKIGLEPLETMQEFRLFDLSTPWGSDK